MNYKTLREQRCAVRDFVDFDSWRNPVALNLTFKQCYWYQPYARTRIDEIHASGCLNHLSNLINSKLLSRSERHQKDRLGFFAVIERDEYKRLHSHAMVECPDAEKLDYLEEIVATLWPQTIWGYEQTVVKPCDDGWLEYMMKLRTKADYLTAHDWSVMHLPKKKKS